MTHRRTQALALALTSLLCLCAIARAELKAGDAATVREAVTMRAYRGHGPRTGHLRPGQHVQITRVKGPWCTIHAGRRTGWVPLANLSAVDEAQGPASASSEMDERPPTRAAAWGGGAAPAAAAAAPPSELVAAAAPAVAQGPAAPSAVGFGLSASSGFAALRHDFQSDATAPLANYRMATSAFSVAVGGLLRYQRGRMELGVEGAYRFTTAMPSLQLKAQSGQQDNVGLRDQTADLGARIGLRSPKGRGAYARFGWHRDAVDLDPSMLAMLPSETITGFTAGAGLELPRILANLGVGLRGDVLLGGSRAQPMGMRDGAQTGTQGYLAGATVTYGLGRAWSASAGYEVSYATTSFSGPSERLGNQGTQEIRSNLDQMLLVGLGYAR